MTTSTLPAILLTDGSDAADRAARDVRSLFGRNISWHLATLVDPHPSLLTGATGFAGPILSATEMEQRDIEHRAAGASAASRTAAALEGRPVETAVLRGSGVMPLVDYAVDGDIDLIVSPTPVGRADQPADRSDLTDDLIRRSPVPVLFAPSEPAVGDDPNTTRARRAPDPDQALTVLIGVDDTGLDDTVVDRALRVFDRATGHRTLQYVVAHVAPARTAIRSLPLATGVFTGETGTAIAAIAEQLAVSARDADAVAERVVDELDIDQAVPDSGTGSDTEIHHAGEAGDPAAALLSLAAEHGADAIVVGTRNRSWFSRLFRPSVAAGVVDRARRPVMVVRSALPDDTAERTNDIESTRPREERNRRNPMNEQPDTTHDGETDVAAETGSGTSAGADDEATPADPRLREVTGDQGMPGSFIDSDRNLPGDQPTDTRGPDKSELEGNG